MTSGDKGRRIAVTGASGLVGSEVCTRLAGRGDTVVRLVRRAASGPNEVRWDPEQGQIDRNGLAGVDAVVHLAGESVAGGRWSEDRKRRILESRTRGTRLIAEAMAEISPRPRALIQASAIGYYGDRGDAWVDEDSTPASDFLADVTQQWEAASEPARAAGIRVVCARIGIVLASDGGALAQLLTPFRLGAGGPVGGGRQYMSWISLTDVASALIHLLDHDEVSGPVNLVAPDPVTNAEFARTLGRVLKRPALLPLPAFAVRLAFGEMGEAILLAGQRVSGDRLRDTGFHFAHPELETALRSELGMV